MFTPLNCRKPVASSTQNKKTTKRPKPKPSRTTTTPRPTKASTTTSPPKTDSGTTEFVLQLRYVFLCLFLLRHTLNYKTLYIQYRIEMLRWHTRLC